MLHANVSTDVYTLTTNIKGLFWPFSRRYSHHSCLIRKTRMKLPCVAVLKLSKLKDSAEKGYFSFNRLSRLCFMVTGLCQYIRKTVFSVFDRNTNHFLF